MARQTGDTSDVVKNDSPMSINEVDTASTNATAMATKAAINGSHVDSGLNAYTQALELDPEHLRRLAKRVRQKLDFILLPLMVSVYMAAYLEKASLNYANAFDLQRDLSLRGRQYSWTVAIAAAGLMIGSYPASLAVQKLHIGKLMSCLLFCWGLCAMALAAANSFDAIFAVRFLLGLSESGIGPAWITITSIFWTRDEQPLRMCIWLGCNGLADIIGTGMAVGLGSVTNTSLHPWQIIFLVIGSIAIALSVVCFFFLPSGPSDAKFLTHEESLAAVWRMSQNQTGMRQGKILKYQMYEALGEFRVWCLLVQQFTIGMFNGALAGYYSAFLVGFGWSSIEAIRYQLPIGAVQLFATVLAGYLASRFRNCTIIIVLILAVCAIVAMVGFSTIPAQQKMALTSCTWIAAAYGGAIVLNWAIVAGNFAGNTKRTTVNGINFVFYWTGNFAGPFVFDQKEAPRYHSATVVLAIMLGLGWVATAAMGIWMRNANRKRDAKAAAGDLAYQPTHGDIEGLTDRTDQENKAFRYRY